MIQSEFQGNIQIYNSHLHAKIHRSLNKSDGKLEKIYWLANQDFDSRPPSARRIQIDP